MPSSTREAAALAQQGLQVGAGHQLHDDERLPVVDAVVVDGDDVGVAKVGRGARLMLELQVEVGVAGLVIAQDLDGHVAVEQGIAPAVNDGHAARTIAFEQLVTVIEQAAFVRLDH